MRGTQAGFQQIVKAARSAEDFCRRRPDLIEIWLILEHFGIDPFAGDVPREVLELAQSYRRLVVGWPK